jgi:hypothetical protein
MVMNFEQLELLKNDFMGEFGSAAQSLRNLDLAKEAEAMEYMNGNLSAGFLQALVAGEFNRGKSTLLNGMLRRELLATRILPCTALITVLRYSEREYVRLLYKDGRTARDLSYEEFTAEYSLTQEDQDSLKFGRATVVLEARESEKDEIQRQREEALKKRLARFDEVECAEFYVNFPLLARGINLVDSPGLAENELRALQTEEHARKANAFIFVLHAGQAPYTQTEKLFLLRLKEAGLHRHLFIVVNWAGLLTRSKRQEVWEGLQAGLAPLFSDDEGVFQPQQFRNRVFMVDLKSLVEAWEEGRKIQVSEETGLPALERALEAYLCGPEPLDAAFRNPVQRLEEYGASAEVSVRQRLRALEQPLAQTEAEIEQAQRKAKTLVERADRLQEQYRMAGDSLANYVYRDLIEFVQQLPSGWSGPTGYANTHLDLKELGMWKVAKALVRKEERNLIHACLERETKRYIESSMAAWAEELAKKPEFGTEVERVNRLLKGGTTEILEQLQQIKRSVGAVDISRTEAEMEERKIEKIIQGMAGLIVGPSLAMAGIVGDGKWSTFLSKALQRVLIGAAIAALTPAGWLVGLVIALEAVFLGLFRDGMTTRLKDALGKEIHHKLIEGVSAAREEMMNPIRGRFMSFGESLCADIRKELDQQKGIWEQLLARKKDQSGELNRARVEMQGHLTRLAECVTKSQARLKTLSVNQTAAA